MSKYRNRSNATTTLAGAIQSKYNDLFQTYPDAYRKDNEALRNYFSPHTKVAESTLGLIVSTFKALCELANFEGVESIQPKEQEVSLQVPDRPHRLNFRR